MGEWEPGLTEAEAGGPLVVDGYGINGLGVYQVVLDDGSTHAAVCVQADVGHSLTADYRVDPGSSFGGELAYLAWAYLSASPPSDVQAAAINVLAWRYAGAQRSTGGPIWNRDEIEVRVLGIGRLTEVEQAIAVLHAEATARRGPWTFTDMTVTDGAVAVAVVGPGGPIDGVAVTFGAATGWSAVVTTGPDGRATTTAPADGDTIEASAEAPGDAITLVAHGSQRLAAAGIPTVLRATQVVPPTTTTTTTPPTTTTTPPTTTTTTATTTTTTTTTTLPTTTTTTTPPTTIPETTTTPPTTTTAPPTTTTAPPTIPVTGTGSRTVGRAGALLFATGALAVLVAAPRRRRAPEPQPVDAASSRSTSASVVAEKSAYHSPTATNRDG